MKKGREGVLSTASSLAEYKHIFTNVGWDTGLVGGGTVNLFPFGCHCVTAAGASSTRAWVAMHGLGQGGPITRIDWDRKLYVMFSIMRTNDVATAQASTLLSESAMVGDIAAQGIGIEIENLTLWGVSWGAGAARAVVDLGTLMVDSQQYDIVIIHDPSVPSIEWYVNQVLSGTQITANNIPAGLAAGPCYFKTDILTLGGLVAYWIAGTVILQEV